MRYSLFCLCLWFLSCAGTISFAQASEQPNVVVILCDDLGYGDVRALNPEGKIATPHMDRLAREGVAFTNAHSSSAVCTPTRYALLTGRYNWRTRLQNGVLGGMSPRLIEQGRHTMAKLLKDQGYHTACIGKWHLGLDWQLKQAPAGDQKFGDSIEKGEEGWRVDFEKPFLNGPLTLGFDQYFGISASLDMVPYTFLQDDRVVVVPTVTKSFPMMLGRAEGKTRAGPAAESFEAEDVLPTFTQKAIEYFESRTSQAKDKPFFLYLPLASPHTPIVPTKAWQGRSGLNPYADFVMQTDDAIGQMLDALDRLKIADNTLVILTSDNGCSPQADFPALEAMGHDPSYRFRGTKADIFEGGHRVPYIARWPGKIAAGTRCESLIGLQDTLGTVADILKVKLPANLGEDSFSWWGHVATSESPKRTSLVHHSINGSFAIRQGDWKLCFCRDSGGWSSPKPNQAASKKLPPLQLYNLRDDLEETKNVAEQHPEIVKELTEQMEQLIKEGRSTQGPPQENTVKVKWPS